MLRRFLAILAFVLTAAGHQQCATPPAPWMQVAYTYSHTSSQDQPRNNPKCYYHNRITREDRDRLFELQDPCHTPASP